jgi:hypothetical protein
MSCLVVLLMTWMQTRTPREMLGRIMALLMFSSTGLAPISQAISGVLSKWKLTMVFAIPGTLVLLLTVWMAFHPDLAGSDRLPASSTAMTVNVFSPAWVAYKMARPPPVVWSRTPFIYTSYTMDGCGVWLSTDCVQNRFISRAPSAASQPCRLPGADGGSVSTPLTAGVVTVTTLLGADTFGGPYKSRALTVIS